MKRLRWVNYALPVLALAFLTLALDSTRAHAAVSISAFNAAPQTTTILVRWTTASELNNAGFNLYRNTSPTGSFSKINPSLIPVKNPGAIIGSSYTYSDNTALKGQTYYYKLESVEFGGGTQQFGPVNATIAEPSPTPTTVPPTATRTPTAQPTATRTPTSVPTATQVPSTATATSVAASPTATRPAAVSEPTRVAVFVEAATPTRAAPARARSSNSSVPPPKSSDPVSVPTTESAAQNLGSQNSQSESSDPTDEPALEETSTSPSLPSPLLVAVTLLGGFAMEIAITIGAVAFYLIAQKLIG